jgi:signal transduction histidine kinase
VEPLEAGGPLYAAVLDGLPAGVAVIDGVTLTVRWANPAFLSLLGERDRATGAIGLSLDSVPPRAARLGDRVRFAVAGGAPAAQIEGEVRAEGAPPRMWRFAIVPLPRVGGGRDALLLAVEITAEVEARRRAEALASVAADLGRGHRLAHVLATGLQRARGLLGGEVALWASVGGRLDALDLHGPVEDAPHPSEAPAVAEALATGRAILLLRSAASAPERDWLARANAGAALLVPLVADERTLGVLVVPRADESAPPPDDVALAGAVAAQIALAASKMTAIELERSHAARLALLQKATAALSAAHATEDVARALFDHGASAIGADVATLVFLDASGHLETVASHGLTPEEQEYFRSFTTGAPYPTAEAVRLCKPVWLDDPDQMDRQFSELAAARRRASHFAWASLPLLVRGEAIGGVGFAWKRPHRFAPEERVFVLAVVEQCAQAIDRARLLDAERRARERAEAAEADARRIGELQERLMAVVGHDLRTPLSAITLATRVLYHQPLGAGAAMTVGRIASSAARMAAIVRDLVDFGRARSGQGLSLERRRVDVAEVCERAIRELSDLHPARDLALETHGDTALDADSDRLAQLVSNLVANALHHGGPAARVRVRAEGAADEVRVIVSDEGAGIAPEQLGDLFEPFHRRVEGHGRGHLGLGLFIVREIARGHGGDVVVRSAPGAGTTFTVRLPRAAPSTDAGGGSE